MKVFTIANVPDELMQSWLQHLRDFDTAHPGCHFEVMTEGTDKSLAEIMEMMRVEPGLTFQTVFERKR